MSINLTIHANTNNHRLAFDAADLEVYTTTTVTTHPSICLRPDHPPHTLRVYLEEHCQGQIADIFAALADGDMEADEQLKSLELELFESVAIYEDGYGTLCWLDGHPDWLLEDQNDSLSGLISDTIEAAALDGLTLHPDTTRAVLLQRIRQMLDDDTSTSEQTAHLVMLLID